MELVKTSVHRTKRRHLIHDFDKFLNIAHVCYKPRPTQWQARSVSIEVVARCLRTPQRIASTTVRSPSPEPQAAHSPSYYTAGTPVFHEGQKGYKCCKPRVLTFDEFLTIPPCTTGKHTTVDDTPAPLKVNPTEAELDAKVKAAAPVKATDVTSQQPAIARQAISAQPAQPSPGPAAAPPEADDSDEESAPPVEGSTCKRKGCG